jgi:hypothetical protein
MVAQSGLRSIDNPRPLCYDSLRSCLGKVGEQAAKIQAVVIMPRIGTARAGGKWEIIEPMILEEVVQKNVNVIVYDLRASL